MDIKYSLLESITNNFSEEQKVGSGGYGDVYKGMYNGKVIAVKRFHYLQGLDNKEFNSEFRNLSKVEHKNVVQLYGYCYESVHKYIPYNGEQVLARQDERLLCFEYMGGGSLDKYIEDEHCRLDWHTCYQIIKGTCDGLNHLHGAHEKPIFHLDLKPSNILLDKNNKTAKISDLGLSRLVASTETHQTEMVNIKGTLGYMPPEYIERGNQGYTRCYKMSLEQFTELAIQNWEGRLQETSRYLSDEKYMLQVKKCIEIAYKCVEQDRNKRPVIKDIVDELEELEANIKDMSLDSDMSIHLIGQSGSKLSLPLSKEYCMQSGSKLSLPLQYLKYITNNFCDERILGKGGFGVVYKGLLDNGEMVAVKKLKQAIPSSQEQFENEVNLLMELKHQNIVQLVGYCYETQHIRTFHKGKPVFVWDTESLLCLECLPNGSLDNYISDASSRLNWHTRWKVIEGISYGLQYLHEHTIEPVIHLDLKPANILLDANMLPKITDFGMSRLFDQNQTIHTVNARGTFGYMPPEFQRGIITPMWDIFSLGVIILEVITGHRDYPHDIRKSSKDFIELELQKWRDRLQTEQGHTSLETDCQQIERCIQIGLICINGERTKRPTIKKVIDMLEGFEKMDQYIRDELSEP